MPEQKLSERQRLTEEIRILEELNRRKALADDGCVFFIENYLMTFDPRPEAFPHHLDFNMDEYPYEREYVNGLVAAIRGGYDIFDEKSRDMGVSWLALAVRFWLWIREPGYQSLLGSRKEEYVDSGDAKSLFWKLDYFIQRIKDPKLLPKGFDPKKHRTHMKLINPVNGNAITGESSNPNFSRGGRYQDVFFDEFGFWPDAQASWTAAGDATHCRHAVTTPPDEPSFAKSVRFSDKTMIRTWHWRLHPRKDDEWYEREKARRSEEEVLHELDISWEYSGVGRPYPEIDTVPTGNYQYDPSSPLYLSMDIGLDAVSIGYYQPLRNSDWITMIGAFESSDHVIEWYFPLLGLGHVVNTPKCTYPKCSRGHHEFNYTDQEIAFFKAINHWAPAYFFGDPSGKQRHVESGISPYTILWQHGITVNTNEAENEWLNRRDESKRMLSRLAINETPQTKWFIECLKNARYPKREETSNLTTEIVKPVHDWTSHHRTQFEFFSVNYKRADYESSLHQRTGFTSDLPPNIEQPTPYRGAAPGVTQTPALDIGAVLMEKSQRGNRSAWDI